MRKAKRTPIKGKASFLSGKLQRMPKTGIQHSTHNVHGIFRECTKRKRNILQHETSKWPAIEQHMLPHNVQGVFVEGSLCSREYPPWHCIPFGVFPASNNDNSFYTLFVLRNVYFSVNCISLVMNTLFNALCNDKSCTYVYYNML